MCKHKNIQCSMFTTFNGPYFARCMDCGEEIICQPPKLRTTATIGKPTDIKTSDTRKRYRQLPKGVSMEQVKCPNCGSDHVEQTADHCKDGYNGYKCNDCGCTFGD